MHSVYKFIVQKIKALVNPAAQQLMANTEYEAWCLLVTMKVMTKDFVDVVRFGNPTQTHQQHNYGAVNRPSTW